jgi:H+/Cl- antiporter ClcA
MALAVTAFLYAAAAVGSVLFVELGAAMLEPSPINTADRDGDRIIALLCATIAAFAALNLGLTIASRRFKRSPHRWPVHRVGRIVVATGLCGLAQLVMWGPGRRWVGALVSDDPQIVDHYGPRGWLLIGTFGATAVCIELLRRAATSPHA